MATNNFFGQLSNQMANTRSQQFQNQMQGRAFNLEMDKESRAFFGNRTNEVFSATRNDLDSLFNAEEKNQFKIYGGADGSGRMPGEQSFDADEIMTIASRKWDLTPGLQNETTKDQYVQNYLTRYLDDSGFSAAAVGTNKKIGTLGYDAETRTYNPTVDTYDPERRQAYEADFTVGGQKVRLGGEPQSLPANALNTALRSYTRNIRNQAGFDTQSAQLAGLYAIKGQQGDPSAMDNLGGPGSFDPQNDIAIRKRLDEEGATMGGSVSSTQSQTTTSEQPTTVTTPEGNETSLTLRQTSDSGAIYTRMNRPYNAEELQNMLKGGSANVKRFDDILGGSSYLYEPGTIPYNLSAEQFNGLQPSQQTRLIDQAKNLTNRNISNGFEQGLEGQEIEKLGDENFGVIRQIAKDSYTLPGGISSGYTVDMWEAKHGEVLPMEGKDKLQTLKAVGEFYKTRKGSAEDKLTDGKVSEVTMHDLLRRHPAYYAQFQELGAVEFAKRYMNDPEFAKNLPTKKEQTQKKVTVNTIEKELVKSLDVSFDMPEGGMTTIHKEMLDFPKPPGTALENSVAALLNDVADNNIDEVDLSFMSRKQRFVMGYTILGATPADRRNEMRPNVDSLIEYGVLKTRLDRTPTPTQVATNIQSAYSTDTTRRGQDITQRGQIFSNENSIRDYNAKIRGQNIDLANSLRTTRNTLLTRQDNQLDDNRKFVTDTETRLVQANRTSDNETQGVDVFTQARTLQGTDLRKFINTPNFNAGMNILSQQVNLAQTPGEAMAIQPFVDNAFYAMLAGRSDNNFKFLSIPSWGREIMNWWRGNVDLAAGDLNYRVIAVADDGAPINDLAQVYHPSNNPNGVKVESFRFIGPDGRIQQGVDISPGATIGQSGLTFYNMILSHSVNTANALGMGGGG